MYADQRGEAVFSRDMMDGLQSLPWRRIEFHYDSGHPLFRLKVIGLALGMA